jgi:hypothetical protein
VIGIITEGSRSHGMYLDLRIFLVYQSFPAVSFFRIGFLGPRMGLLETSLEAIVFAVGFLWNFLQ